MKTTDILLLAAVGVGVYLITRPKKTYVDPNSQLPQAPPQLSTAQQGQQWANLVISLTGSVTDMFKPGGAFYNEKKGAAEIAKRDFNALAAEMGVTPEQLMIQISAFGGVPPIIL